MRTITNQPFVLVYPEDGSTHIDTFKSKMDVVMGLLSNGSIADKPDWWGGPAHVAALDIVEKEIAELRERIAVEAQAEAEREFNNEQREDIE